MSETDFLKLKKHDNVETNTEKFDIENYLNGNWDKIDKNVGEVNTSISNINSKNKEQDTNIEQLQESTETSSNKIAELEKELKEAQEDFYQNSIRGQASGEYIHVEDSSNCRSIIGISGNHEQETRAGYNKLNMSNAKGGTSGGITCVINEDGSYQFKGTATTTDNGSVNVWFLGYYNSKAPTLFTLEAGTYYINDVLLFSGIKKLNEPLKKIYTFTSEVNITGVRAMSATPGQTYNEVKYPIIAKSNKELTWEQYGAMPSPDYRSKVVTVGSNVNLANKDNITNLYFNQNQISVGSTSKTMIENCLPNTTYTISKIKSTKFRVCTTNKTPQTNESIIDYIYNDNGDKITITTSDKAKYMCIYFYDSGTDTLEEQGILDSIKIEKGTVATPWSQHGQGCVKVTKCNKNLFDKNTTTDGKYIGGNGSVQTQSNIMHSDYIQIKTNINYYITGRSDLSRVALYDKNKTFLEITSTTQPNGVLNVTNSNCKYIIINALLTNKDTLQIEEKTATAYEEHREQSYIMPTQKEMLQGDYFDFDNEEEVHTKAKLVLTGNENWKLESTGRFGIIKSDLPEIPAATSNDNDYLGNMCNSYKESTPVLTWKKVQGFCVDMSSCLRIYDDKYSTNNDLEGFKTYLKSQYDAGTPVIIYYKLQTPTRLAFTDEQKAVAKELNNARTYKNVTNITTDSKAILSLDYAKDQETQNQKMQNEIDEIKQLLSTTQTSALLLDNMQTDIESEVK